MADSEFPPPSSVSRIERHEWASLLRDLQGVSPLGADETTTPERNEWVEGWSKQFPLHRACRANAPDEVFGAIIQHFPRSSEERCGTIGCVPHHFVPPGKSRVLEALVAVNPGGVRQPCKEGRIPLHYIVAKHHETDCVDILLREYPEGAAVADKNGTLPLHSACQEGVQSLDVVKALLAAYPKAASIKDSDGKLALHWVCETGALDLLPDLLAAYPQGARERDNFGVVPFLEAVENDCEFDDEDLISLLEQYPEALYVRDDKGKCAADVVSTMEGGHLESVLRAAYPYGLNVPDDDGLLPLHKACLLGAPEEATKTLYSLCPEAAQMKDNKGRFPLHIAAEACGNCPEVVAFLATVYGAALSVPDGNGQTPFRVASLSSGSLDVVYTLLRQFPEAVLAITA